MQRTKKRFINNTKPTFSSKYKGSCHKHLTFLSQFSYFYLGFDWTGKCWAVCKRELLYLLWIERSWTSLSKINNRLGGCSYAKANSHVENYWIFFPVVSFVTGGKKNWSRSSLQLIINVPIWKRQHKSSCWLFFS